jgi:phospholipid transport system substrate-binding protein
MHEAGASNFEKRYEQLEPVVSAVFDTPAIAKVILSRYWDTLNEDQRREFENLLERFSIATYASRFDGYSGESFMESPPQQIQSGRMLVKASLKRPNEEDVSLDYVLQQGADGSWRIVSVMADGVNDLALRRAEYATIIREKGFDGLVQKLENKIADLGHAKVHAT